jgi:cytochrome c-type protein NapC
MEQNVYREYKRTIHYNNRTGVRATCPDCHVPKTWVHKIARKIQASNELYHHFLGTISTREKYEAKRLELASNVWRAMKQTDSRECRNCHNFEYMDFAVQEKRSRNRHEEAIDEGKTCIDCHKGIAHELPEGAYDAESEINQDSGDS